MEGPAGRLRHLHVRCGTGVPVRVAADAVTLTRTPAMLSLRWVQGNGMLWILQVLHVWWTYILLRIAFKLLLGSSGHKAGAAEYEGDSDAENTVFARASDAEGDQKKRD